MRRVNRDQATLGPSRSLSTLACPAGRGNLGFPTVTCSSPVGPAPSRRETLVEETTAESSDDEVVAPSQVTARGGAGSLGSFEVGVPGQALTHHAVVG